MKRAQKPDGWPRSWESITSTEWMIYLFVLWLMSRFW